MLVSATKYPFCTEESSLSLKSQNEVTQWQLTVSEIFCQIVGADNVNDVFDLSLRAPSHKDTALIILTYLLSVFQDHTMRIPMQGHNTKMTVRSLKCLLLFLCVFVAGQLVCSRTQFPPKKQKAKRIRKAGGLTGSGL